MEESQETILQLEKINENLRIELAKAERRFLVLIKENENLGKLNDQKILDLK
jgi:hypothetical protein